MITPTELSTLSDIINGSNKTTTDFQGNRIVTEYCVDGFIYTILVQDPIYGKWHEMEVSDDSWATEEEAIKEGKSFIDNWEPSDDYYGQ